LRITRPQVPYEGHYIHRDTKLVSKTEKLASPKGIMLSKRDKEVKYLLETLPEGIDSFFNWNFFDTMLQKEGYSSYVLRILQPRS
jgi:hypothetical protein